jgi:hypothetical protein
MGMSTYVVGIKPPGERWKEMKQIYDACAAAGIDPPDSVTEFFDHEPPDEKGVIVNIDEDVTEWVDENRRGYDVRVKNLPEDIEIVRFYNSW